MVKVRLQRVGAKKRPYYRIVIATSTAKRDGRFIEIVGTYDPLQKPSKVTVKEDRIRYWISQGARPTETVNRILKKEGISAKQE